MKEYREIKLLENQNLYEIVANNRYGSFSYNELFATKNFTIEDHSYVQANQDFVDNKVLPALLNVIYQFNEKGNGWTELGIRYPVSRHEMNNILSLGIRLLVDDSCPIDEELIYEIRINGRYYNKLGFYERIRLSLREIIYTVYDDKLQTPIYYKEIPIKKLEGRILCLGDTTVENKNKLYFLEKMVAEMRQEFEGIYFSEDPIDYLPEIQKFDDFIVALDTVIKYTQGCEKSDFRNIFSFFPTAYWRYDKYHSEDEENYTNEDSWRIFYDAVQDCNAAELLYKLKRVRTNMRLLRELYTQN